MCADLLYDLALMIAALDALVPAGSATTVYLSMLLRPKTLGAGWCRDFWAELVERGFALRRVAVEWAPRRGYRDYVFTLARRSGYKDCCWHG